MHGSSEKVIRIVSHAFPKLGSGAMGSRFREQSTHWTDPAVFSQPDQWKGFLSVMVTAHEADLLYMRNFLDEITKNKYNRGGLTLKKASSQTLSRATRRESCPFVSVWSDEFSSWVERIDQDFEKLLRLAAQMQEWDKDKFIAEAQQGYRLGADKVAEFDKHIYLAMKRFTTGIAREIVDTSKTAGEAWYRPPDRFYGRNVGATAIASQLQELKRPTQIAESFHLLNVIRKLVREFARQSPKEPMPTVKAAYRRVVPETYRRAMETHVDVDKVEPHNLEDKVLAFIRNNTSGAAPMNIGNIAPGQTPTPGLGSPSQSTTSSSHGGSDSYPDLNNYEYAAQWGQDWNTGDADTSGSSDCELYGLQKGKGKWKFQRHLLQLWKVKSFCQVLLCKRWKKQKERERRETAKVGMTVKVGQSEMDGQKVKVETRQAKVERDSKQYDVLVMETSTQEKTVRDGDWCVPVKHVAKLSRMIGSTSTNTNIKFFVDPEEEDQDNDTTSDCLRSKQSVTNAVVVRLMACSGNEREISPPRGQLYVFPA